MAKHVLHSEGELDFALTGISSTEDQYRTVSLVNDALNINLVLADFVTLQLSENQEFQYSLYRYIDESTLLEFLLVPNLSNYQEQKRNAGQNLFSGMEVDESTRLVKEMPRIDYFLIIKGESPHHVQHRIQALLKQVASISQVQMIDPMVLPSRRNLIF